MSWEWNGKTITTIGDLGDALCALASREEGQAFMAVYRAVTEHADVNVGYVAGYYDAATMARINDYTATEHPIFGRSLPTSEEAFAAGQQMGQEAQS